MVKPNSPLGIARVAIGREVRVIAKSGVDPEDVEKHLRGLIKIGVLRERDGRLEAVVEPVRGAETGS